VAYWIRLIYDVTVVWLCLCPVSMVIYCLCFYMLLFAVESMIIIKSFK